MSGPSNFTEANALLAVQEGRLAEAQHAIDKMLPTERRRLARACVMLHEMLTAPPAPNHNNNNKEITR